MSVSLEDMKKALIKRRSSEYKDMLKQLEEGVIKPVSMDEKEKAEATEFKIKTGTLIDDIIGGGIPEGKSMVAYGEFASGKTQTCITTVALCPDSVIYIDTEGSIRAGRLRQICESRNLDWEKVKKKIVLFEPKSWVEQLLVFFSLPAPTDVEQKVGLIICDSISKHFRGIEFVGRENLQIKNGFLRNFVLDLEKLAQQHRAALLYTTQIYDVPSVGPFSSITDIQKPIGGRSLEHQPDFIIHFRKGRGNIRVARMMDSSWNPLGERSFVINEKGIDFIPQEASAYSTEENRSKSFTRKQQQEDIKSRKKKEESEE